MNSLPPEPAPARGVSAGSGSCPSSCTRDAARVRAFGSPWTGSPFLDEDHHDRLQPGTRCRCGAGSRRHFHRWLRDPEVEPPAPPSSAGGTPPWTDSRPAGDPRPYPGSPEDGLPAVGGDPGGSGPALLPRVC